MNNKIFNDFHNNVREKNKEWECVTLVGKFLQKNNATELQKHDLTTAYEYYIDVSMTLNSLREQYLGAEKITISYWKKKKVLGQIKQIESLKGAMRTRINNLKRSILGKKENSDDKTISNHIADTYTIYIVLRKDLPEIQSKFYRMTQGKIAKNEPEYSDADYDYAFKTT